MVIDPRRIEVVDDHVAEILRRKTPAEKIAMASAMWRSARSMIEHHLHDRHPDWTPEQIKTEVARRMSRGAI